MQKKKKKVRENGDCAPRPLYKILILKLIDFNFLFILSLL